MSRTFNGTSQYGLATAPTALTDYPFTLAVWVKSTATSGTVLKITDANGYPSAYPSISIYGSGGNISAELSAPYANTSNSTASTAWVHMCGIWTSTTCRIVLNGDWANSGTGTSVAFNTAWDDIGAAALVNGDGAAEFHACSIAHGALWNVALSQTDVEGLYNGGAGGGGKNPLAVQNANLIAYWPLAGDASPEPDDKGSYDLTLYNTPTDGASDPTVDAPPATGAPRAAAYYRMMRNR